MKKSMAKQNHNALTIRPSPVDSAAIDILMRFTGKGTAAGALLFAADRYPSLSMERDKLEEQLKELEQKHFNLLADIGDGLSAYNRIVKALKQ